MVIKLPPQLKDGLDFQYFYVVLRRYSSECWTFSNEIYFDRKIYRFLVADINDLTVSALVLLETRLKLLILAVFDDF